MGNLTFSTSQGSLDGKPYLLDFSGVTKWETLRLCLPGGHPVGSLTSSTSRGSPSGKLYLFDSQGVTKWETLPPRTPGGHRMGNFPSSNQPPSFDENFSIPTPPRRTCFQRTLSRNTGHQYIPNNYCKCCCMAGSLAIHASKFRSVRVADVPTASYNTWPFIPFQYVGFTTVPLLLAKLYAIMVSSMLRSTTCLPLACARSQAALHQPKSTSTVF